MADLTNKLSQFGETIIYTAANGYLAALNAKMNESIAKQITIKTSYLSKYQVIEELRERLNNDYRTTKFPASTISDEAFTKIQPLLDTTKDIISIVKESEDDYKELASYLNELADNAPNAFDPPLLEPASTPSGNTIYQIPASEELDPRRFARVLEFDTFDSSVRKFLINNAPLYGFTLYMNYGLYYIGFKEVQQKAQSEGVLKILNQFQETQIKQSEVTLTASTIAAAKDPVVGDLDIATTSVPVQNNDGQTITELAVVDGQIVPLPTAKAYMLMKAAAKAEGLNLVVGSGFRPAVAPKAITWNSASGKRGTLTSQVQVREKSNRWKVNYKDFYSKYMGSQPKPASPVRASQPPGATGTNVGTQYSETRVHWSSGGSANGKWGPMIGSDAFIYYAPSAAYSANTAPPGHSNHGSGIAIDLNTGSGLSSMIKNGQLTENGARYRWLCYNSWKYGFIRGVSSEEWHFEYFPQKARTKGPYALIPKSKALWFDELQLKDIPFTPY